MNAFNRILSIMLLLALLVLAIVVAWNPVQAIAVVQQTLANVATFLGELATSRVWLYALGRAGLAILAAVLLLPLIWAEIRPRQVRAANLQMASGGKATVSTESVSRRLSWHIDQLADVVSVTPSVLPRGKTVDVALEVETSPEIDVPMKTEEIIAVTREVLTERMGLQVGKVSVNIRHAPYQN